MKKVTIIMGRSYSGKSFLADNISLAYENPLTIPGRGTLLLCPFRFTEVTRETDLIIFEDVTPDNFELLRTLVFEDQLRVERQGEKPSELPIPKIIIVLDSETTFAHYPFSQRLMRQSNLILCHRDRFSGSFAFGRYQPVVQ